MEALNSQFMVSMTDGEKVLDPLPAFVQYLVSGDVSRETKPLLVSICSQRKGGKLLKKRV